MDWISEHPGWFTLILAVASLIFFAGRWVGGINDLKDTVGTAISEIRDDIKKIFERLPPPTISQTSPLKLTDLGRDISGEVNASQWADTNSKRLMERLRGKKPFEIQEFCFKYVKGAEFKPTPETENAIRESAYNHGTTVDQVKDVFAIELRDALLSLTGQSPPD